MAEEEAAAPRAAAVAMLQCSGCMSVLQGAEEFQVMAADGVVVGGPQELEPSPAEGPADSVGGGALFDGACFRAGHVSQAELDAGIFSDVQFWGPAEAGGLPYAYIGPRAGDGCTGCEEEVALPTVLAISGEEQLHVSKFFRAWRAEERGWQVIIPLRTASGTPYLFDPPGVSQVAELMRQLLAREARARLPGTHAVRGGKLHLVGASNGGASVLAAAASAPELVASLTLVTGFVPSTLEDLEPLQRVPRVRLLAGTDDEFGHQEALSELHVRLESLDMSAELQILSGAGHFNIGLFIDMSAFWAWLECAQPTPERAAGTG